MKLFLSAITKFSLGILLVGALIFLPAGSWHFWQGWLLMGILFIPMFVAGLVMLGKSPDLLKSRLNAKEKRTRQDVVVKLSGLMFIVGFVVAGLGVRFGWYILPPWVSVAAAAVFLLGYGLYAEVLRENAYLSRTIQVQEGQRVVSTGLYGVVRHPMYAATLLLFLSMPLILGSLYALAIFAAYPVIIAARIRDEEALLEDQLEGYAEYREKVRWRLIPFIW